MRGYTCGVFGGYRKGKRAILAKKVPEKVKDALRCPRRRPGHALLPHQKAIIRQLGREMSYELPSKSGFSRTTSKSKSRSRSRSLSKGRTAGVSHRGVNYSCDPAGAREDMMRIKAARMLEYSHSRSLGGGCTIAGGGPSVDYVPTFGPTVGSKRLHAYAQRMLNRWRLQKQTNAVKARAAAVKFRAATDELARRGQHSIHQVLQSFK
jgi:hypothetical protein